MSLTVIGLVGGIASGKSTVATHFAALRPGVRVDADALAHRALDRPAVREAIARRFPGTAGRDGKTDREKLAAVVFRDAQALQDLERITHPVIRRAIRRQIRDAEGPYVFLDAALLQETGAVELCDWVVYVACPARVRRSRARRDRGWSEAEHRRREARQWPCARKRAGADFVVDNSGDARRCRNDVRRALRAIERERGER